MCNTLCISLNLIYLGWINWLTFNHNIVLNCTVNSHCELKVNGCERSRGLRACVYVCVILSFILSLSLSLSLNVCSFCCCCYYWKSMCFSLSLSLHDCWHFCWDLSCQRLNDYTVLWLCGCEGRSLVEILSLCPFWSNCLDTFSLFLCVSISLTL